MAVVVRHVTSASEDDQGCAKSKISTIEIYRLQ